LTDPLVLVQKLAMLREHLSRIRTRRPATATEFASDTLVQDAIALNLLVAAQEAADIAIHIAVDEAWGVPGSHREAFELIALHGVITTEHARELAGVVAVRNRIAHGYGSVDTDRIWAELPAGLDALDRYVEAIAKHSAP
jgi:uncharacterized protein YutE (UPF0331/DUF86 family)